VSEHERPATRFQSKPHQDGTVVVDAWHDDALIAFCPKLDAAAAFAMFLNGQEGLARQVRTELLNSLPVRK
jgi:ABC-type glycerol-3-phosphate transport system substrate-binding protein